MTGLGVAMRVVKSIGRNGVGCHRIGWDEMGWNRDETRMGWNRMAGRISGLAWIGQASGWREIYWLPGYARSEGEHSDPDAAVREVDGH